MTGALRRCPKEIILKLPRGPGQDVTSLGIQRQSAGPMNPGLILEFSDFTGAHHLVASDRENELKFLSPQISQGIHSTSNLLIFDRMEF